MCRPQRAAGLLIAFSAWLASNAWSAPTLIEHVQGYTLAANHLESFSALVFEAGKVLEAGDAAELRKKYLNLPMPKGLVITHIFT